MTGRPDRGGAAVGPAFGATGGSRPGTGASAAWPALLIAILLLLPAATPRPAQIGWAGLLAVALVLTVLLRSNAVAVVALLAAGIGLRLAFIGIGSSDVLTVTRAAAELTLAGGNPYGIGYDVSRPPGAPFPYGPVALLWYVPVLTYPVLMELAVSILVLVALAVRGGPYGVALYAAAPILYVTAGDGSNDNSLGLLLLVALLAARRSVVVGGALLGVATAFKPFAAAWIPSLVAWGGVPALLGVAAGGAVAWGPALLAFGAGPMAASVRRAQEIHPSPFYSLAAVVEGLTGRLTIRPAFDGFRLVAGALLAVVTMLVARTWTRVVVSGAAVYLVTLYAGYWATFAYLAALAPILCWQLDEWLGLGDRRVRWPLDPVARIGGWLDRRWPARA